MKGKVGIACQRAGSGQRVTQHRRNQTRRPQARRNRFGLSIAVPIIRGQMQRIVVARGRSKSIKVIYRTQAGYLSFVTDFKLREGAIFINCHLELAFR